MAKITVVDTSVGDRIKIVNALEPEGHKLTEESDGQEALAAILHDPPDLVITELVLFGLDGFKLIRAIREMSTTIPILVQTNMVRDSMRDSCLSMGVTAFIRKPVNSIALSATVREILTGEIAVTS